MRAHYNCLYKGYGVGIAKLPPHARFSFRDIWGSDIYLTKRFRYVVSHRTGRIYRYLR